jgi:hypothetical protein
MRNWNNQSVDDGKCDMSIRHWLEIIFFNPAVSTVSKVLIAFVAHVAQTLQNVIKIVKKVVII